MHPITPLLERKKRYTRAYREAYYVLTPAGFLHEYASSDPAVADRPLFSLFLPMCTLGPPSPPSTKSHKFHIEPRKDGTGSVRTGSIRNLTRSMTSLGVGSSGGPGGAWCRTSYGGVVGGCWAYDVPGPGWVPGAGRHTERLLEGAGRMTSRTPGVPLAPDVIRSGCSGVLGV